MGKTMRTVLCAGVGAAIGTTAGILVGTFLLGDNTVAARLEGDTAGALKGVDPDDLLEEDEEDDTPNAFVPPVQSLFDNVNDEESVE